MRLGKEKEEKEGPKEEIGKCHEVGDALKHASGLEHKRGERHPREIHPDSAANMSGYPGSIATTTPTSAARSAPQRPSPPTRRAPMHRRRRHRTASGTIAGA